MPKLKSGRPTGLRPLRYWPMLLIATAVAESVHAPTLTLSNAAPAKEEANPPKSTASAEPSAPIFKRPGGSTVDPTSSADDDLDSKKGLDTNLAPASLAPLDPQPPISLVPRQRSDELGMTIPEVTAGPSGNAADPLLQPPSPRAREQLPYSPGGGVHPGDNDGPGAGGSDHHQSTVTTSASVPEPGAGVLPVISVLAMLRRRRRIH